MEKDLLESILHSEDIEPIDSEQFNIDDILNEDYSNSKLFYSKKIINEYASEKKIEEPTLEKKEEIQNLFAENKKNIEIDEFMKEILDIGPSDDYSYDQQVVNKILKNMEEELKPEISNIKAKLNPIDEIDNEERELCKTNSDNSKLESKFIVSKSNKFLERKKIENVIYIPLEDISSHIFSQLKGNLNEIAIGLPRSITIVPDKYIIFGTSYCLVCVYSFSQKLIKILGTAKEQSYGSVISMDVTNDADSIVCGHENGQIVIWDLNNGTQIKTIQNLHTSPVLSVCFWKGSKSHIISSDNSQFVYLLTISKVLFSHTVDKKLLLHNSAGNVHSIKVLDKVFTNNTPFSSFTLISVCSLSVVLVISLEPIIKILFKLERPQSAKDGSVPSISWGKASAPLKHGERTVASTALAIAWGNVIEIYPLKNMMDTKGLQSVCHFYNENEIVFMEFISESFLFCIDVKKCIRIVYTGLFQFGKFKENSFSLENLNYSNCVISFELVDNDILYQTFLKDNNLRVRSCYQNTVKIFCNSKNNYAFFIGFRKIYKAKILNWLDFVQEQMDKGEWLTTLRNNVMFTGIPSNLVTAKPKMQIYFIKIVERYVNHLLQIYPVNSQQNHWQSHLLSIIDFLLACENHKYLFTEFKAFLKENELNEVFLSSLEPFIIANQITWVPNEEFRDVVRYFQKQKKEKVLQHLIVNLNISSIDTCFLVTICLEYKLFTALIYICTRSDNDFITPLVQLFAFYKQKKKKLENASKFGYKCLWYIKITLEGELFPNRKIEEKVYKSIISQLIVWIFVEENLQLLLEIDQLISFQIFFMFFKEKPAQILKEFDPNIIHFFECQNEDSKHKKLSKKEKEKYKEFSENYIHINMLKSILKLENSLPLPKNFELDDEKKNPYIINFIANIAVVGTIPIDFELSVESALFLLKNPNWIVMINGNISFDDDFDEIYLEKNQMILSLLRPHENLLKSNLNQKIFSDLISFAELSPLY